MRVKMEQKSSEKQETPAWKVHELGDRNATMKKQAKFMKLTMDKQDELKRRGKTKKGREYDEALKERVAEKNKNKIPLTAEEVADLGLEFKVIPYKQAKDNNMRRALRFQFDGVIYSKPDFYSKFYKNKIADKKPVEGFSFEDYDLKKNPYLKACSEFDEYETYKDDLTVAIMETGVKPEEIGKLSQDDIKGCLIDVCSKKGKIRKDFKTGEDWISNDGGKMGFVFEGAREKFVKNLGKNYSKALTKALVKAGRTKEDAEFEVKRMAERGQAPRGFNVHHKYPIGGSAAKNYPFVNDPKNFVVIENNSCHMSIHNFMEQTMGLNSYHKDKTDKEIYPIMVKPKDGIVFFAGSCKNMQVTTEQTNDNTRSKVKKISDAVKKAILSTMGR
jgi:hypothetical protein